MTTVPNERRPICNGQSHCPLGSDHDGANHTTRTECPYCGVAKPLSQFDAEFDGCADCAKERRECAYHVGLHPDEKCTCPKRRKAEPSDPVAAHCLNCKGWDLRVGNVAIRGPGFTDRPPEAFQRVGCMDCGQDLGIACTTSGQPLVWRRDESSAEPTRTEAGEPHAATDDELFEQWYERYRCGQSLDFKRLVHDGWRGALQHISTERETLRRAVAEHEECIGELEYAEENANLKAELLRLKAPGTLYARAERIGQLAEAKLGHSPLSSEPPELVIERALDELLRLCGPVCPHDQKRVTEHVHGRDWCRTWHHAYQPSASGELCLARRHVVGARGHTCRKPEAAYVHQPCETVHPTWRAGEEWLRRNAR